jgi:hypothetical protein
LPIIVKHCPSSWRVTPSPKHCPPSWSIAHHREALPIIVESYPIAEAQPTVVKHCPIVKHCPSRSIAHRGAFPIVTLLHIVKHCPSWCIAHIVWSTAVREAALPIAKYYAHREALPVAKHCPS